MDCISQFIQYNSVRVDIGPDGLSQSLSPAAGIHLLVVVPAGQGLAESVTVSGQADRRSTHSAGAAAITGLGLPIATNSSRITLSQVGIDRNDSPELVPGAELLNMARLHNVVPTVTGTHGYIPALAGYKQGHFITCRRVNITTGQLPDNTGGVDENGESNILVKRRANDKNVRRDIFVNSTGQLPDNACCSMAGSGLVAIAVVSHAYGVQHNSTGSGLPDSILDNRCSIVDKQGENVRNSGAIVQNPIINHGASILDNGPVIVNINGQLVHNSGVIVDNGQLPDITVEVLLEKFPGTKLIKLSLLAKSAPSNEVGRSSEVPARRCGVSSRLQISPATEISRYFATFYTYWCGEVRGDAR